MSVPSENNLFCFPGISSCCFSGNLSPPINVLKRNLPEINKPPGNKGLIEVTLVFSKTCLIHVQH